MKLQDPLHTRVDKMRELLKIQGAKGNWDYDNYMLGMFNGMELMMCTVENRAPKYRTAHFYGPVSKGLRHAAISSEALEPFELLAMGRYYDFTKEDEGDINDERAIAYRVFLLFVAEAISEEGL